MWEGAEKLDEKNDMYLILIHFFLSKPIMAHQLTRRVGGAEKLDKIDAYYLNLLILFNI